MGIMKKLLVFASVLAATSAMAEKWDRSNNPHYFEIITDGPMNVEFRSLPLSSKLLDDRFGWSESYWPSNKGGIAYRWNSPNPQPFEYKLLKKEDLKKMTEAQLSELSPAELYDISQGDYKYSLTKKVLRSLSPDDLWWEGICHGWSQAASNYPEPDKVVITNKDGIKVPFGSSDVKGLLSMHDAFNSKGLYTRIGDRCAVEGKVPGEASTEDGHAPMPDARLANLPECSDVNAGAFHVVLSNMIGVYSKGFVADVDRFNDVWNQPVVGYESAVVEELGASLEEQKNGIDKKVRVKTVMTYGEELEFFNPESAAEGQLNFVSKDPVTATSAQAFKSKNYEYILELDKSGKITGGKWISATRPDMLWMKKKDEKFRDGRFPLEGLNRIYKAITR
jgi:hypothetical protein